MEYGNNSSSSEILPEDWKAPIENLRDVLKDRHSVRNILLSFPLSFGGDVISVCLDVQMSVRMSKCLSRCSDEAWRCYWKWHLGLHARFWSVCLSVCPDVLMRFGDVTGNAI